jgi:hypothetical protein
MSQHQTISTETWRVILPNDWIEKAVDSPVAYFESQDSSRGLYMMTVLCKESDDEHGTKQAIDSLLRAQENALAVMEGYNWKVVSSGHICRRGVPGLAIEYFAVERSYRIACLFLVAIPWMLRATLHDYLCEDLDLSRRELATILDSIEVHT